jgi:hypothetical protein
VLFVAVNSGNSAEAVRDYLAVVECPWPAIVDEDRSFETACGVGEISLQNVWQTCVITPEGTLFFANVDGLERHLRTAKWRIDPQGIPAALRDAWRALEFGQTSAAIARLQGVATSSPEEEAARARLHAEVGSQLAARLTAAQGLASEDRLWEASRAYQRILDEFSGYDAARLAEVSGALAELVPGLLQEVWRALELTEPAAFQRLSEELGNVLALRMEAAKTLAEEGKPWEAAKAYQCLLDDFGGFDKSRLVGAAEALRELQKNEVVKNETQAMKALERAREKLASSADTKDDPARNELRKLVEKYPSTEAARLAQELLRSP